MKGSRIHAGRPAGRRTGLRPESGSSERPGAASRHLFM